MDWSRSGHQSFDQESAVPAELFSTLRWYACRTRARAEKRTNRLLAGRCIESYVPLIEEVRQWTDRKKRVAFPLLPGYVFARIDLRRTHDVLSTPGILGIVRANGYPTPLQDGELESIRILANAVNAGEEMPRPVEHLTVGQEVVVTDGPFAGMRGVLLEELARVRIAVRLSVLHRAMSVALPREMLRPVWRDRRVS